MLVQPKELADAGFYFLGERDHTKCFYCGGGLHNWEMMDDPWYEHAKWYPTCEYLLRKKGLEFVTCVGEMYPLLKHPQMVNPQTMNNKTQEGSVTSQQNDVTQLVVETERLRKRVLQIQAEHTCKICLDRETDVVLLPCGHICCCKSCGHALRRCPLCRVQLKEIVKIFKS